MVQTLLLTSSLPGDSVQKRGQRLRHQILLGQWGLIPLSVKSVWSRQTPEQILDNTTKPNSVAIQNLKKINYFHKAYIYIYISSPAPPAAHYK